MTVFEILNGKQSVKGVVEGIVKEMVKAYYLGEGCMTGMEVDGFKNVLMSSLHVFSSQNR